MIILVALINTGIHAMLYDLASESLIPAETGAKPTASCSCCCCICGYCGRSYLIHLCGHSTPAITQVPAAEAVTATESGLSWTKLEVEMVLRDLAISNVVYSVGSAASEPKLLCIEIGDDDIPTVITATTMYL